MGGGKMGGRGRFLRPGPVSGTPDMCIRAQKHFPEGPAEGGAPLEGGFGPLLGGSEANFGSFKQNPGD